MDREQRESCLMLAVNLEMPVQFDSLLNEDDLKDGEATLKDYHITLYYKDGEFIEGKDAKRTVLTPELASSMKESDYESVTENFDLGMFSGGDHDHLILRLKEESPWFKLVKDANKKMCSKWGDNPKFPDYKPHVTLATLNKGTASKYLMSKEIDLVLKSSVVRFEDLVISYERNYQVDLTINKSVERFFRLKELREFDKQQSEIK